MLSSFTCDSGAGCRSLSSSRADLAVFSDDNDDTVEVGEYDLTFSTNARECTIPGSSAERLVADMQACADW